MTDIETSKALPSKYDGVCIPLPSSLGGGKICRISDLQWTVERNGKTLYYSDLVWCLKDVFRHSVGNGPDMRTLRDILMRVNSIEDKILAIAKDAYSARHED